MKPLLLLDLDGTLFKTYDFWQDFCFALSDATGKNPKEFKHSYEHYSLGSGKTLYIDFNTLMEDTNIERQKILDALKNISRNKSYLFDDAKILLKALPQLQDRFDVAILTFGQTFFQQLKLDYTPEIKQYPAYITDQLKTEYIKENFANRPSGVLVDDKPDQNLPNSWTEINVDRRASNHLQPEEINDGIFRITQLDDAIALLHKI